MNMRTCIYMRAYMYEQYMYEHLCIHTYMYTFTHAYTYTYGMELSVESGVWGFGSVLCIWALTIALAQTNMKAQKVLKETTPFHGG